MQRYNFFRQRQLLQKMQQLLQLSALENRLNMPRNGRFISLEQLRHTIQSKLHRVVDQRYLNPAGAICRTIQ